ncbi:MAG: HIT family protein [Planctomycetota bacterium]
MQECIFCKIGQHKARSWMVAESANAFAILDIHPMSRWHTMVMPKKHYADIFDIPTGVLQEVMATLKDVVDLYHSKLGINDVQVISSNGSAAQQDVFHSHWHIAPRHEGDGQDVKWKLYPEMVSEYNEMLEQLGTGKFIDASIT